MFASRRKSGKSTSVAGSVRRRFLPEAAKEPLDLNYVDRCGLDTASRLVLLKRQLCRAEQPFTTGIRSLGSEWPLTPRAEAGGKLVNFCFVDAPA